MSILEIILITYIAVIQILIVLIAAVPRGRFLYAVMTALIILSPLVWWLGVVAMISDMRRNKRRKMRDELEKRYAKEQEAKPNE